MSDTGSFPLAPPLYPGTAPRPALVPPGDATFVLPPRPAAVERHGETSTASYTAQDAQAPPLSAEPERVRRGGHRRARSARRPGPPAKVALPLLLLALACYAIGFWALARI
jgi:eukaryotic-like serine/threonine-protein kinase